MGYDMTLVRRDTSKDAELEQARKDFDEACTLRGNLPPGSEGYDAAQAKVEEAYGRLSSADINYFRLNVWGMSTMRDHMDTLGMLADRYPMPEFPSAEEFGITNEEWWEFDPDEVDENDSTPVKPGVLKMHEASEIHRRWSPQDVPGIPAHKLGSNDGWIVTPFDCRAALDAYANAKASNPEAVEAIRAEWAEGDGSNYFDEWIAWLERAAAGSGFQVY